MSQLDLSWTEERRAREASIQARFEEFHAANPHVYLKLCQLAREAKALGQTKLGIRMLWEVMRWQLTVQTTRAEGDPKMNDQYTSRYVRLIQICEPDLRGMFDTRELRS